MKLLRVAFVALLVAVPASADFLCDLGGPSYDYTFPIAGGDFAAPNNYYEAVGAVPTVNPAYLTADHGNNQYTFYMLSDFLSTADTVGTFGIFTYLPNSYVGIYEDPISTGTAYDFGINPQNPTVPLTFVDGTMILGGTINGLTVVVDLNTLDGSLSGVVDWNAGSQLGGLPANSTSEFAVIGTDAIGLPTGYVWDLDGQMTITLTTATENTSWGKIKGLFSDR